MLTVSAKMTRLFFDRAAVRARLGERKAKALSLLGRDVQQKARALIGKKAKRTRPRPPGKPPKAHVEDSDSHASLRKILYHLEPARDNVIIGPVGISQKHHGGISVGTVPALHEFGGTAVIREKRVGREWRSFGRLRPRPGQPTRTRKATYPARPFMRPAMQHVIDRRLKRGTLPGLTVGPGVSASIGP